MHELNIFFNTTFVGILKYDENTETFDLEYDGIWKEKGFPISPKLDFQKNYTNKDVN